MVSTDCWVEFIFTTMDTTKLVFHLQITDYNPGREGFSEHFWVVCHWDSEALTLYLTIFSCILQLYSRLDAKNPYPIIPDLLYSYH